MKQKNVLLDSDSRIAASPKISPIVLSPSHIAAVNRRRRIIVQFDAVGEGLHTLGIDIKKWFHFRFNFADDPATHIDTLCWDIGLGESAAYPSKVLPPLEAPGLKKWQSEGIDWVQVCVAETKKRKLEAFWNHRISEVDVPPTESEKFGEYQHPLKKMHPDWLIKCWWPQGLWNLAVPEVWEYKLKQLRELAENYDLDGIQLDFSRHTPSLPPGHQWEHRACATEFVRRVRLMLLDVEGKKGRPILLAAKVPENLEGCRSDGFDIETWAQENLVDIFSLGSRSIDVDLAAFRRIRNLTAGKNIKFYPCFDSHHTTEAYFDPPLEFLRGIYANWWQQGSDGVETFNWPNATLEAYREVGIKPDHDPSRHYQACHEIGDPEAMRFKDKIFVVQRRGGYPYREGGNISSNGFAQLPADLANDGRMTALAIHISDDIAGAEKDGKLKEAILRVILFNVMEGDTIDVALNGVALELLAADEKWKDPQIFSPGPLPSQMPAKWAYKIDPEQKLLLLVYKIIPGHANIGENRVGLRVTGRKSYPACTHIKIEKVEVLVNYP